MTESKLTINTAQRWQDLSDEWERSPMSQKQFCKIKNISYAVFGAWRSKILKQEGRSRSPMQPVAIKAQPLSQASAIQVALPCGVRLMVAPGADPETLKMILNCVRD